MFHKVFKIVALILSLLGVVFLVRIIAEGDEEIKAAALAGDTAIVDPMAFVAYSVLLIVLVFVVGFVFKNLFSNTSGLKNTLIGIGAFILVLVVAFALSDTENPMLKDGKYLYRYGDNIATSNEIKMSGAGLVAFYILIILAAATMLFAGVKKVISK